MTRERPARQVGRAGAMLGALSSALLVCGCMMQPAPKAAAQAATVALPQEEEAPLPPRPARKPQVPMLAARPATPDPTPAPAPEPGLSQGFERLQGLDQGETKAFLGEPLQRAESPPAVLWRYASQDCALDVYFYLDLESREMRVLHYEVRNTDGSERPQQACYGELVTDRRADEAGSADRSR
jgi:hypothetical protein